MELADTIELMQNEDFKKRFAAEYAQLVIRKNGLAAMLKKAHEGTLHFKPKCSLYLLGMQLKSMEDYAKTLEIRAEIEEIELPFQ